MGKKNKGWTDAKQSPVLYKKWNKHTKQNKQKTIHIIYIPYDPGMKTSPRIHKGKLTIIILLQFFLILITPTPNHQGKYNYKPPLKEQNKFETNQFETKKETNKKEIISIKLFLLSSLPTLADSLDLFLRGLGFSGIAANSMESVNAEGQPTER